MCNDLEVVDTCTARVNCGNDTTLRFGERIGSISNQGGGAGRDIVISAYLERQGRVFIIDGAHDSTADGVLSIGESSGYITRLTGAPGQVRFGSGVANNATAISSPDVDDDGVEDLVVAGGAGSGNVELYVWYGGAIPGDDTSASAGSTVSAHSEFTNAYTEGYVGSLSATWAGDVNDDNLSDICWGDFQIEYSDGTPNNWEGAFEVLWDDGV